MEFQQHGDFRARLGYDPHHARGLILLQILESMTFCLKGECDSNGHFFSFALTSRRTRNMHSV